MAKQIEKVLKLQIRGGAANPAPPVGPALGAAGVNIMEFCKQFNARSQDKPGKILPVVISVFKDKSFDFVIKTPPAAVQLLEATKIKKQLEMMKKTNGFHFIIIDELFHSTNPEEAVEGGKKILKEINGNLKCCCLFSTHLNKLIGTTP